MNRQRLILALGWFVVFAYGYPGRMTPESFAYLRQARGKFYSDAYAPAMASLVRVIEIVLTAPSALLLLQTIAFVAGAYALLSRVMSRAEWATVGLCVVPPVLAGITAISTHAMAIALLVGGAGALVHGWRRVGLAALCVATAVEPVAAVVTLLLIGARRRIQIGVWVAITIVAVGGDFLLARMKGHVWHPYATETIEVVDDPLKLGVPTRTSEFQDAADVIVEPLATRWIYVVLGAGLVAIAWKERRS